MATTMASKLSSADGGSTAWATRMAHCPSWTKRTLRVPPVSAALSW
jgi:hypothetical protein